MQEELTDYTPDVVIENGEMRDNTQKAVYPSREIPDSGATGERLWNLIRGEEIP